MSSKKYIVSIGFILFIAALLLRPPPLASYELFIYRLFEDPPSLAREKKIFVFGEFFGQFLSPSTFPSYNDLSGEDDRWNFGFRNYLFLTPNTMLHAQLLTHDNGTVRTKFDWHFSLHQSWGRYLEVFIGHDSDHDSDHVSTIQEKSSFTNRNYIGIGFPTRGKIFVIEPFIWFFHHTNQRIYLDLSGDKLKQEIGLRLGALPTKHLSLSSQLIFQSDALFSLGQMLLFDLVLRNKLTAWLEISLGTSLWRDRETSPMGNKKTFYKFYWGIAVPF